MFPNNPLFIEKLVHAKQEDIRHEIQGTHEPSVPVKMKNKVFTIIILLVALAWFFSVIL